MSVSTGEGDGKVIAREEIPFPHSCENENLNNIQVKKINKYPTNYGPNKVIGFCLVCNRQTTYQLGRCGIGTCSADYHQVKDLPREETFKYYPQVTLDEVDDSESKIFEKARQRLFPEGEVTLKDGNIFFKENSNDESSNQLSCLASPIRQKNPRKEVTNG